MVPYDEAAGCALHMDSHNWFSSFVVDGFTLNDPTGLASDAMLLNHYGSNRCPVTLKNLSITRAGTKAFDGVDLRGNLALVLDTATFNFAASGSDYVASPAATSPGRSAR